MQTTRSDYFLKDELKKLIFEVKNWDKIAQPIQLSKMSQGLSHNISTRMANKVKGLAYILANDFMLLLRKLKH